MSTGPSHLLLRTCGTSASLCHSLISSIPPLIASSHKGKSGKIAVLGGSDDYTGAPYFSAMASLTSGSDLSHVFSPSETAVKVIKGYSPELMVHPCYRIGGDFKDNGKDNCYDEDERDAGDIAMEEIGKWCKAGRIHAFVIGPGFGLGDISKRLTLKAFAHAAKEDVSIVVDADAVTLMCEIIKERSNERGSNGSDTVSFPFSLVNDGKCVITPNAMEYERLSIALGLGSGTLDPVDGPFACLPELAPNYDRIYEIYECENDDNDVSTSSDGGDKDITPALRKAHRHVCALSDSLGVTVLRKGPIDLIAEPKFISNDYSLPCNNNNNNNESSDNDAVHKDIRGQNNENDGKLRRGFACAVQGSLRRCGGQGDVLSGVIATFLAWNRNDPSLAATAGCLVTRTAARIAFEEKKRAMTASDVLAKVGPAFELLFPA